MAPECRGNYSGLTSVNLPWQLPWSPVAIAAYWRIAVAFAADARGMPLFSVEMAVAITMEFRGNCRGVRWQLPLIGG